MNKAPRCCGVLVVVLLVLLLAAGDAAAQVAAKPVTVRYAYIFPVADYLPLWVGQEKGYFRQENLAIDLITLSTGDKQVLGLVSGSVEISSYTPDWYIRAIEKGEAKIRIVMGHSNIPVYSLVVRPEIKSYADLKGKRIAVATLKSSDVYLIQRMMAANGLKEGDYILIQAGAGTERYATLKAGGVSATMMIPPFDQRVVDEGYRRLDVSSNVVTQYTWFSYAVREDWARANRATLVAFMRAWVRATRWVYAPGNEEEAIQILGRAMKLEDRYARGVYEMYLRAKNWARDGEVDLVGLQAVMSAMADQGDLARPFPKPEKYLDLIYLEEALRTLR